MPDSAPHTEKKLKIGLGEAIQRLTHVEAMYRRGVSSVPAELLAERDLLVSAMNNIQIDLGFDCNQDGIPDTVEIFQKTASTSCCRLVPFSSSRKPPKAAASPPAPILAPTSTPAAGGLMAAHSRRGTSTSRRG
jgi:hypothetical protein